MLGKDGPRRFQVRKAWLSTTRPMREVSPAETVAFFRSLAPQGDRPLDENGKVRAVKAREILDSCFYPHITKEVRRLKHDGE